MQNIMSVRESLEQGSLDQRIKEIYVDEQRVPYNRERYIRAIDRFTELLRYIVRRGAVRYVAIIRTIRMVWCLRLQSIWMPLRSWQRQRSR